jgi:hypothetical protein
MTLLIKSTHTCGQHLVKGPRRVVSSLSERVEEGAAVGAPAPDPGVSPPARGGRRGEGAVACSAAAPSSLQIEAIGGEGRGRSLAERSVSLHPQRLQ